MKLISIKHRILISECSVYDLAEHEYAMYIVMCMGLNTYRGKTNA